MKKIILLLGAVGLVAVVFVGFSSAPGTRIGTYDSRAIAIAFGNSSEGMEFVTNLRAEMAKAKEAKNDSLMRSIEKTGKTQQVLMHLRAFSTGSVADILEKHKAEVDAVAKEAGVQVIVSKFELNYAAAGIDTVDVTSALVQIFKPREQVLKWLSGLSNQKPLSMLEVLAIPPEE